VLPLCAVWGAAFLVAVYGLKRRALHLPRPPVVFITIGLSLGLWAPVAFEQAVGKPGNLTAVTGFIGDNPGQVVVGDSARAGLIAISECFLSPIGIGGQVRPEGLNQLVCISLTLILMAIFVATLYNRLRKREPQSIAAFACGSALLTGSFITLAIMSDQFPVENPENRHQRPGHTHFIVDRLDFVRPTTFPSRMDQLGVGSCCVWR